MNLFGWGKPKVSYSDTIGSSISTTVSFDVEPMATPVPDSLPRMDVDDLARFTASAPGQAHARQSIFDGEKFLGGFGATELLQTDYWTLRRRSSQLFTTNLYARGIIRRLVTNIINIGLTPEAMPDENILGIEEDSLGDWSENVENRFQIWAKNPKLCDWKQRLTFGAIQRLAKLEAIVAGDVLVVMRISPVTGLPMVQLVPGEAVQTPLLEASANIPKSHIIRHGVEMDGNGRVVAHWILQEDGTSKRIAAFGRKSGRRISWLVYGTDKRVDEIRGEPILALVLQSLKEIDRYRDSAQRKAVINSILAMYISKEQDKMGTLPVTGGAVAKTSIQTTESDGTPRNYKLAGQVPGLVMEELQQGERPNAFSSQGTDVNFGVFEAAVVQGFAWALEIPPEILTLAFSNNYSASQAALNEFKIFINGEWVAWGEDFCTPIYTEWMVSETLDGRIDTPGFLEAWRDPLQYDTLGAWLSVEWYGSIKLSTDMLKQAKGSELLTANAWSNNAREARTTTGTKFSKNVKRLKKENEQLAEALRPMAEFNQEFGNGAPEEADTGTEPAETQE